MNIKDISAIRGCTSCQMCAAVCPKNAISIDLDREGFYRPAIDDSLCIDCDLCTKVCYKFDNNIEPFGKEKLDKTQLFGAYAKKPEILRQTTSGGIADLLARELLAEGYKCVGVVYDSEKDRAIDVVGQTQEDISRFRGSKYIQSYTLDAFREVVNGARKDKYAVFGTPCHIYALDKYLRFRGFRENVILIDLYCHGCPSMNIWKKYIKDVKAKTKVERFDNVNFRSKVKGWGNSYIISADTDGKTVYTSKRLNDNFFDLFFSDIVLNESCNTCLLRSTLNYTDIRLGDFWGKRYVINNNGVSAVCLVTEKARKLFMNISVSAIINEENYGDFLPWQSWEKNHTPNPELRKILIDQLMDDNITLRESIETIHCRETLMQKMVRYAKNMICNLPLSWQKRIRWIFYKI